jgi:hypothetical protein
MNDRILRKFAKIVNMHTKMAEKVINHIIYRKVRMQNQRKIKEAELEKVMIEKNRKTKAKSYEEFAKDFLNIDIKNIEKEKEKIQNLREKRKQALKDKKLSGIKRKEKLKYLKILENILKLDDLLIINGFSNSDAMSDIKDAMSGIKEEYNCYYLIAKYKKTTIHIEMKYDLKKLSEIRSYYGSYTKKIGDGVPTISVIYERSQIEIARYNNIMITNDEKNRLIKMLSSKKETIISEVEEDLLNI